ncbi:uncharacterized protein RBU47_000456 [Passerculus sandwichensis]
MSTKPKLYYFDGRGKMESIRWLLAAAGVEFEEEFLETRDQYEKLLQGGSLLFQQVPMVEIDGMKMVQTRAILNYIAAKYNLYGKDLKERALIDMYVGGTDDLMGFILMFPFLSAEDKDKQHALIVQKATGRYFPVYEKVLKDHGQDFLVGNSFSWADVHLLEAILMVEEKKSDVLSGFPQLQAFKARISSIPAIKKFLEPGSQRKPVPDDKYVETVRRVLRMYYDVKANYGCAWLCSAGTACGRLEPPVAGWNRLEPPVAGCVRREPLVSGWNRLCLAVFGGNRLRPAGSGWNRLWPAVSGWNRLCLAVFGGNRLWPAGSGCGRQGQPRPPLTEPPLEPMPRTAVPGLKGWSLCGFPSGSRGSPGPAGAGHAFEVQESRVRVPERAGRGALRFPQGPSVGSGWSEAVQPGAILSHRAPKYLSGNQELRIMSGKPRLTYLNGRGRMEPIRWLLAAAGVEFEEVYLETKEQYEKLIKDGFLLFQQVPLVEIDGMKMVQTRAIMSYIAGKYNLYGKDLKERAMIDMYVEGISDLMQMILMFPFSPPDAKEKNLESIKERATNRYFPVFEKVLKQHGQDFLVGNKFSWADVQLMEAILAVEEKVPDVLSGFPQLQVFKTKMSNMPTIKKFLQPGSPRKPPPDAHYVETVLKVFKK